MCETSNIPAEDLQARCSSWIESYTILAIQTHGNQPSLPLTLDGKHTTQYALVDYLTRTFAEAIGAIISLLAN